MHLWVIVFPKNTFGRLWIALHERLEDKVTEHAVLAAMIEYSAKHFKLFLFIQAALANCFQHVVIRQGICRLVAAQFTVCLPSNNKTLLPPLCIFPQGVGCAFDEYIIGNVITFRHLFPYLICVQAFICMRRQGVGIQERIPVNDGRLEFFQ